MGLIGSRWFNWLNNKLGGNLFKRTHADSHSISLSAFVSYTMGRTHRTKRKGQKGGARFRRKLRLVDKIAEGVAMGLSGPSPSFPKMGAFLAKQAFKGIKDNVHHYQRGKGLGTVLSTAVKIGYKSGKDKGYKRMGAVRTTGHYKHFRKPWKT